MLSVLALVLTLSTIGQAQTPPSLLESYLNLVTVDGPGNMRQEPQDRRFVNEEYDFIIVGAGTAGCTLANRLTEVPEWKVLLIEAGGPESFIFDVPILANFLQFGSTNWNYKTEPSNTYCLGMNKNQCHWPRGKVMGGSSVLNYMIYTRGNRRDYDEWERMGNKGWGWRDVLPYFKKLENTEIPEYTDGKLRSTGGYLSVSTIPYKTPVAHAFVEAGREQGYRVGDYNGRYQSGFDYLQVSMRNGTRWSSNRAYLYPANNRPNLHVKKNSLVTKILINKQTRQAYGVEFTSNNRRFVVRARKEVILSAGAINSPQLLMLSGVGPRSHLESHGIPVVNDLKVGYNLQDHVSVGGLTYTITKPYSIQTLRLINNSTNLINYFSFHQGPLSIPGGCEAVAFIDTLKPKTTSTDWPDLELLFVSGGLNSEETLRRNFNLKRDIYDIYMRVGNRDSIMVFPMIMRPKSTGRIKLKRNDPYKKPAIIANYFSDGEGEDMRVALAGIKLTHEVLTKSQAFRQMGIKRVKVSLPDCPFAYDSDDYWKCFTRHFPFTIYHYVGTCKMGPDSDPDAVVNDKLQVRGVGNLRVIDASIMPKVITGHTNGPTYMIAEKGSDMIKKFWLNRRSS